MSSEKDKQLAAKIAALEGRMSGSGSNPPVGLGESKAGGSFSSSSVTVLDQSASYQVVHPSNSNTNTSGVVPLNLTVVELKDKGAFRCSILATRSDSRGFVPG